MPTIQPDFLKSLQRVNDRASLTALEKEQIKRALIATIQRPPEEAIAITLATDKPSPAGTAA